LTEADVIIVGAGSAGCTLAWRLSGNPALRIQVIERGSKSSSLLLRMPAGVGKLVADPDHTMFYPVDSPGRNAPMMVPRGSTLGGSSAINGMIWVPGHPQDFDNWEAMGNRGWNSANMAKAYEALIWSGPGRPPAGRVPVALPGRRNALAEAWVGALGKMGVPRRDAIDRGGAEGAEYNLFNCWRSERWSTARTFLEPARLRGNVEVITETEVERIIFEGRRAVGVVGRRGGETVTFRCNRDVIVAANAYGSPRLLQISGIGPAQHARKCGIDVVADSPNVGANLQDHVPFAFQYRLVGRQGLNHQLRGWRLGLNALRYGLRRSGPLSVSPFWTGAGVDTTGAHGRADAYCYLLPMSMTIRDGKPALESQPGMMMGGYFLRPRSLGSVLINCPDPARPARITANSLSDPVDAAAGVRVFRYLRKLAAMPPLADMIAAETFPVHPPETDAEIADWIQQATNGGGHSVGTCRMGPRDTDVLDERLRVRAVEGLRVIDTSAIPCIPSCNTNAPTIALAWRAADLVLEDLAA